ncbi:MAG: response regulator [Cyanobacteria bacterium J06621_11]
MFNSALHRPSAEMPQEMSAERSTILVVDDNPNNIRVLCRFLSDCNYRIAIAKSGEKALKRIHQISPDIILLDVMMPGIDGFETCRQLKQNPQTRDIPVLFMTALSDSINKVKGLSFGAVDYITKPIECEETLARVKVHLELRQAQARLVQEEKMAALGQLVAGVAHEINNPISFIQGNIEPAEEYVQSLLKLIELHEDHPSPSPAARAYAKEIDVNFIRQDFIQLIRSMSIGADRIQKIVQSLRTFSRLDEADYKPIDIHEGLDSTLTVLDSRFRANDYRTKIEVVKDYRLNCPVDCYPSRLNQVFLNLITNAIDAIDDKFTTHPQTLSTLESPTLHISTELVDGEAVIQITDSGTGIPKSAQSKIFDQFFTTKPVGQGTGLGLTIARTIIVQDHKGSLTFSSFEDEGTTFTIKFPLGNLPE